MLQSEMRIVDIISRKRDGLRLSDNEISMIVGGFTGGDVPDYQMSAFLMAVVWRGLDDDETASLTGCMVASGATLDLSGISGIKLDKHSTGGIGDKVTLAVVPLLAAAGIPIAKMSGRGLGYTGGTIDKLESIPGFRTNLTASEIVAQVKKIGACICAQTDDLVPADRKMYALRDVTATVESIPLIASSIMSKKIACGADVILLDVKVGRGAFMKTRRAARALGLALVRLGEAHGKRVVACITDMNVPLGRAIGNCLEVAEIADLLQGRPTDRRLAESVIHLTRLGLELAGQNPADAESLLSSGKGWAKFREIVEAQGGDLSVFDSPRAAPHRVGVAAEAAGTVGDIDALVIGTAAMLLGAGRQTKGDAINPLAGILLTKCVGDRVRVGDIVAELHTSAPSTIGEATRLVREAFVIGHKRPTRRPLVYEIIGQASGGAL